MTATPNLGYQNFYSTTLAQTLTASDTTIYLNSLPTPSEGYLVIEPDSSTNREIIYYTSKGANFVTCPSVSDGRGVGGTSAGAHTSGVAVQMNNNAELWTAIQDGSANTGLHQWFNDSFNDYFQSGGSVTAATGLIASISSGVAYINGRRLTFNAISKTLTANKDTYIDIVAPSSVDNIATVSYTELASGATGSVPTANGIHLAFVNTATTSIATISQGTVPVLNDNLGYPLYQSTPGSKGAIGYAEIRSNFTTTTTSSDVAITGLSTTVNLDVASRLKITVFVNDLLKSGSAGDTLFLKLKEGSTQLAESQANIAGSNYGIMGATCSCVITAAAGTHVYSAAVLQSTAGTITVTAGTGGKASYILVEKI